MRGSSAGCANSSLGIVTPRPRDRVERQDRLAVAEVPHETSRALAQLAARSMQLQVTIQDGHVFVADGESSVPVELVIRKSLVR